VPLDPLEPLLPDVPDEPFAPPDALKTCPVVLSIDKK
jgi:hypothetical protein